MLLCIRMRLTFGDPTVDFHTREPIIALFFPNNLSGIYLPLVSGFCTHSLRLLLVKTDIEGKPRA